MTLKTKFYIAAGIVALAFIFGTYAWSKHRTANLQKAVDSAKQIAEQAGKYAIAKETEAAQYKHKTIYLEKQIAEIQAIARNQDEELEKLNVTAADARSNVERARSIRSITSTAGELCAKLAELSHPCE